MDEVDGLYNNCNMNAVDCTLIYADGQVPFVTTENPTPTFTIANTR